MFWLRIVSKALPLVVVLCMLLPLGSFAFAENCDPWETNGGPYCTISPGQPEVPKICVDYCMTFGVSGGDQDERDCTCPPETQYEEDGLNLAAAEWTASAGTPSTHTGSSFAWKAPPYPAAVTITVDVPDNAALADDAEDAHAEKQVDVLKPNTVKVSALDDHDIHYTQNEDDADPDNDLPGLTGPAIVDPIYNTLVSPTKDDPFYDTRNTKTHLSAVLKVSPSLDLYAPVELNADSSLVTTYEGGGGGLVYISNPIDIGQSTTALYNYIFATDLDSDWKLKVCSNTYVCSLNTTDHEMWASLDSVDELSKIPTWLLRQNEEELEEVGAAQPFVQEVFDKWAGDDADPPYDPNDPGREWLQTAGNDRNAVETREAMVPDEEWVKLRDYLPGHPGGDLGRTPYIECRQEARTVDPLIAGDDASLT